ncbi:MAG TPA: ester cyclase [Rugosimonospora sp.]|nr:ester cyclase [Rugosimonospora sp.]
MSEAAELAREHHRAFNDRAWSRAPQLYSPDVVMIEPGGTSHGIDAFLAHSQGFARAFPDSRAEITSLIEAGDLVAVEAVYTGTNTGPLATPAGELPPTGQALTLPYCAVFEVVAGRIVQQRVYYDQATFAVQLGLAPQPA